MKRALVALVLFLLVVSPVWGHDWSAVAKKVKASSFPLMTASGEIFCTGFIVDAKRHYGLTAEHCVSGGWVRMGMLVDGKVADVIRASEDLDVAVLYLPENTRPALKPNLGVLYEGIAVASFGFAREKNLYGHFRVGNLAAVHARIDMLPGLWVVVDQPFIGGMSGGPVVDTKGRVIAQVQRSDRALTGIGRSVGEIWRATRGYWGH